MNVAPLLDVRDLRVQFRGRRARLVKAVDGVSFTVGAGESVGLVGESGSGKTTVAHAVLGLVPIAAGSVRFGGLDMAGAGRADWRRFRERVQMIFQDPFGSLNPRLTVGGAIAEVLRVHGDGSQAGRGADAVAALLESVGLDRGFAPRYPHELSGGQRQRVGLARALAVRPSLLVADEPVSALDVSIQAQILDLMRDLRQRLGIAWLLISHDLAVVYAMCERVLVMYRGRLVETGTREQVFRTPAHPYTRALLAAVPDVGRGLARRRDGSRPAPARADAAAMRAPPAGCPYHPRCPVAQPRCLAESPVPRPLSEDRACACFQAPAP